MSKKQAIIMEVLRVLHSKDVGSESGRVIEVSLDCGSKVFILVEIKDKKSKLKLVKAG